MKKNSLLLMALAFGLSSCNINTLNSSSEKPTINSFVEENNKEINYSTSINENSLIGIAAYYEFDNKVVNNISNISIKNKNSDLIDSDYESKEEEYLKISYPYDYVKIISAYKFNIYVDDIEDQVAKEIIENSCGLGELEVVISEFETYVEKGETRYPSVQDTLISLRGYNGYYTILVNSGVYTNNNSLEVFSSHKKLLDEEVSKDFTPPILSIFLEKKNNNEHYLYFETSNDLLSFGNYNVEKAFKNTTEIEIVSRSTMYSTYELTKMPIKEISASVINIDIENKYLEVETIDKLKYVYFNEYTEGVDITCINVGDVILVEYDFLFEKYNPIRVYANTIYSNVNTLTFKFVVEEKNTLKEVEETNRFTFSYTYFENHIITEEEFDEIYYDLNKEIPINNGGYYSFGGFYNNLEMDQSIRFGEGFKVDKDYIFYYTIIGGPAPRPQSMN